MILSDLSLFQFRNAVDCTVSFSPQLNVMIGHNGQGKTNLVEAIHLLSTSKSFRTARSKELIAWGKKEGSVFGHIQTAAGDLRLGVILSPSSRMLMQNGTAIKAASFISSFVTITFSPADIEVIKGEAAIRRQFLDKHVADIFPAAIHHLLSYARAQKNKVALLKQGATPHSIRPWNELMAIHGFQIDQYRQRVIQELAQKASWYHQQFAHVDGALELSLERKSDEPHETIDDFRMLFEKNIDREIASERSLVGPHRDDLELCYQGISARKFGSQGQSKSIAIALRLGLIDIIKEHRGEAPVVILDDVDSELDGVRLKKLYNLLLEGSYQVFITGTSENQALSSAEGRCKRFEISAGQIIEKQ